MYLRYMSQTTQKNILHINIAFQKYRKTFATYFLRTLDIQINNETMNINR